jgi:hypothetical protein
MGTDRKGVISHAQIQLAVSAVAVQIKEGTETINHDVSKINDSLETMML